MMIVQSRFEDGVTERELHDAVPFTQSWSPEQLCILNDFAHWLDMWRRGFAPTGPRMVIEAVAGSGKTTVLKAMLVIVRRLCPSSPTIASAFNKHIAKAMREALVEERRNGLSGATLLGRSNTVNAGGYDLLRTECHKRGLNMSVEPGVPKYRVICRQVWADFLGNLGKQLEYEGGRDWRILMVIADELEVPPSPRQLWFRVARDLESFVAVLQDCGFNPSKNINEDRRKIEAIIEENMESRSLEGSSLWAFPYSLNSLDMARDVLIIGRDRAFDPTEITPKDMDNAVVPRPSFHKGTGFMQDAKYDTGLYPLRRLGSDRNYWANKTQLLWPPRRHRWSSGDGRQTSNDTCVMSFSDQIWLPSALGLSLNKYQIAFIDEIQDLSVTKGDLIRSLLVDDGSETVVLVGDIRQGIMGWAGADREAVNTNALASKCIAYPMTYSWRGSYAVAESARGITHEATNMAQKLWPRYDFPAFQDHQAPRSVSSWPKGKDEITISENDLASRVKELRANNPDATQAIVSRLNGPLGTVAIELVKQGIPISTPDSKEILDSIKWVLKNEYKPPKNKHEKKGVAFENPPGSTLERCRTGGYFRSRFRMLKLWCQEQAIERAGGDKKVAEIEDRYVKEQDDIDLAESLVTLYARDNEPASKLTFSKSLGLQEETFEYSMSRFNKWVKNELFGDSDNPVHLTSVHRYKGAEADYIYILRSLTMGEEQRNIFLLDHMMNKSPQTAQEEVCILYVAATRARMQNIQVVTEEEI